MKIDIVPYNERWKESFKEIKTEIEESLISIKPRIDHIGSTSVKGLSAKPIIDMLVGIKEESQLDKTISPLSGNGYIYYEIYNPVMPYRRFFVKLKNNYKSNLIIKSENDIDENLLVHSNRIAHIHVIPENSIHWIRHIAFKEYLTMNMKIKKEYQDLKERLSLRQWKNGNDYNEAKNDFIKFHEEQAIKWCQKNY